MALVLGWGAVAMAQAAPAKATVSDAEVEANVLKALAGASSLANQPMTTTTVYGVVTLSGSVQTEALRTEAETIVSRTSGVQKVVDEMTLSSEAASAADASGHESEPAVRRNDGAAAGFAGVRQYAAAKPDSQFGSKPGRWPQRRAGRA